MSGFKQVMALPSISYSSTFTRTNALTAFSGPGPCANTPNHDCDSDGVVAPSYGCQQHTITAAPAATSGLARIGCSVEGAVLVCVGMIFIYGVAILVLADAL